MQPDASFFPAACSDVALFLKMSKLYKNNETEVGWENENKLRSLRTKNWINWNNDDLHFF